MASVPAQTVRRLGAQTTKLAVAPRGHRMLRVPRSRMRGRLLVDARVAAVTVQSHLLDTSPRSSQLIRIADSGGGSGDASSHAFADCSQTTGGPRLLRSSTAARARGNALGVVSKRYSQMRVPGREVLLLPPPALRDLARGGRPKHLRMVPTNCRSRSGSTRGSLDQRPRRLQHPINPPTNWATCRRSRDRVAVLVRCSRRGARRLRSVGVAMFEAPAFGRQHIPHELTAVAPTKMREVEPIGRGPTSSSGLNKRVTNLRTAIRTSATVCPMRPIGPLVPPAQWGRTSALKKCVAGRRVPRVKPATLIGTTTDINSTRPRNRRGATTASARTGAIGPTRFERTTWERWTTR